MKPQPWAEHLCEPIGRNDGVSLGHSCVALQEPTLMALVLAWPVEGLGPSQMGFLGVL